MNYYGDYYGEYDIKNQLRHYEVSNQTRMHATFGAIWSKNLDYRNFSDESLLQN